MKLQKLKKEQVIKAVRNPSFFLNSKKHSAIETLEKITLSSLALTMLIGKILSQTHRL
jgi:hypothetical protein